MKRSLDPPVVAAVIRRNDRFLICRRAVGQRHGGKWEFPGGKVRVGELMKEAVGRELDEELQVSVTGVHEPLFSTVDPASGLEIFFLPVQISGQPRPVEHEEIVWSRLGDLLTYPLAPSDREFCRFLISAWDDIRRPVIPESVVNALFLF